MKLSLNPIAGLGLAAWMFALEASALAAEPPEPKFTTVTLDDHIQIGYGLAIADVDGDGHPDILLADKKQFVWYRNPGPNQARDPAAWHKYLLAENLTEDDNVCIAAQDIDGDGKCEIAVGAAWKPSDTEKSGAVFYLIPPADRTQPWTPVKFPAVEPTTHRMKWFEAEEHKWGLVVVPLHGRGNKNGEGAPVKVIIYYPPADPHGKWDSEVIVESMHMMHNLDIEHVEGPFAKANSLFLVGREGYCWARRFPDGWHVIPHRQTQLHPEYPGIGELRHGFARNPGHLAMEPFTATIEPMHGNELVAYVPIKTSEPIIMDRKVITDKLVEGHALACGDLLGVHSDQIVAGWRGKAGQPDSGQGLSVWTPLGAYGEGWREGVVDPDGMACEDLQLADLTGDGKLDIIASGRRTHNVKIYFNDTAPPKP